MIDLDVLALIVSPISIDVLRVLPFSDQLNYDVNEKLYPVDSSFVVSLFGAVI